MRTPEYGAPLVVLGAPLTIDADAFKTASGDLEGSLRLICEKFTAMATFRWGRKTMTASRRSSISGPRNSTSSCARSSGPTIGADDVLLEVAAVGVCGSDLHQWTAEHSWPVNYPVVLGHEFAGVVAEVGQARAAAGAKAIAASARRPP